MDHSGVAVIGSRGGVGASTIAQNLAWLMADEQKAPICLLDCDHAFGSQAMAFNVSPNQGLIDILTNNKALDENTVRNQAVKITDYLDLYCSNINVDQHAEFSRDDLFQVMSLLARHYRGFIFDMPRHELKAHQQWLQACNMVCIITTQNLLGLRDTKRVMQVIKALAPEAECRVIVNHAAGESGAEIDSAEFAEQLGSDIAITLPHAPKPIKMAMSMSECLVKNKPSHAISKKLSQLAQQLRPDSGLLPSLTYWQKLWRVE